MTWQAAMQIYRNKRPFLHKKNVQLPTDWFGTSTWPRFCCFETLKWQTWRPKRLPWSWGSLRSRRLEVVGWGEDHCHWENRSEDPSFLIFFFWGRGGLVFSLFFYSHTKSRYKYLFCGLDKWNAAYFLYFDHPASYNTGRDRAILSFPMLSPS